jgi:hypothetical protein
MLAREINGSGIRQNFRGRGLLAESIIVKLDSSLSSDA